MNDGDEQIYDLSPLSPSADIDEIRDHLMRLHSWRRAREPVSEGGILAKYVTNGALVARGLLSFSPGVSGAGTDGWTPSASGGSDGLAGINATLLALTSTGFAFLFADTTATTTTSPDLVFTANLTNVAGTVAFSGTAYDAANAVVGVAGDVTFTSVTATSATLTGANFHRGGSTIRYVKVTATLGALTDTMTVYRGDNGSDGVQVRLTNEAHTIAAEEDGTVIAYTGASGTMQAYKGVNLLSNVTTPSVSFSIVGFTGFTAAYSTPGTSFFSGALTISATTGAYQVSGNIDTAATAVTVTFRATLSTGETRDSIFSISKSLTGSAGKSIKAVSNAGNAFVGTTTGTGFTPSTLELTRTLLGGLTLSGTTVWTITRGSFTGSLVVVNTTTGTFGAFDADDMGDDVVTFRCTHTEGGESYTDDITIFKTKDAMSAYLSNDSISLPASNAGVISSYVGATGTLKVVNAAGDVGTSALTFSIAGHSGFNTVYPVNTGISITSGGVYTVSSGVADASDVAWVDFQASYADPLGGTKIFTRRFTIGKSKTGTAGANGTNGNDGARGSLTLYSASVSPAINLSGTTWPDDATSPYGTNDNNASKIVWQALGNSAGSFVSNSISHLRVGDTVTLTDAAGTLSIQKFFGGPSSGWLTPGVVISGNLLVGGTISGQVNLNITGSAEFQGFNAITLPDPETGIDGSLTVAALANRSYATQIGFGGVSNSGNKSGVYGYNANTLSGYGTVGFGWTGVKGQGSYRGVLGSSTASGGIGLEGRGSGAGSIGVFAQADGGSAWGAKFTTSGSFSGASSVAVQIDVGHANNQGLVCNGSASFSKQIASTLSTGTAPFVVASTTQVANLNVSLLAGAAPSASTVWWPTGGAIPVISNSGVMEGPKYIDFHATSTESNATIDYGARLELVNGTSTGQGYLRLTAHDGSSANQAMTVLASAAPVANNGTALTGSAGPAGPASYTLKWAKVNIAGAPAWLACLQ